jgi:hypothetical protein
MKGRSLQRGGGASGSEFEALQRVLSRLNACNTQARYAVEAGVHLANLDFSRRFAGVESFRRSPMPEQECFWSDLGELELGLRSQESGTAMGVSLYRIWLADTLGGRRRAAELLVKELTELGRRAYKRFDVSPGGKLVIDVNGGGIKVTGTKEDAVTIDLFRDVRVFDLQGNRDKEKEQEILGANESALRQDGCTVSVLTAEKKNSQLSHPGNVNIDFRFDVSVPDNFNLDLKTSGGGITVAELAGAVKSKTSGGALSFTNVRGRIDGHTSGGGIQLKACQGAASIETAGGTIDIRDHKGDVTARSSGGGIRCERVEGRLDAQTYGGSIDVLFEAQPTRDCHLATCGGGITVRLRGSSRLNIEAETSPGAVDSELPVSVIGKQEGTNLQGKLNGGGPLLTLHTRAGGVYIKQL